MATEPPQENDDRRHLGTTTTTTCGTNSASVRGYMPAMAVRELGLAPGDPVGWYLEDGRVYATPTPADDERDYPAHPGKNVYRCQECGVEGVKASGGVRARQACQNCEAVTTWERVDEGEAGSA